MGRFGDFAAHHLIEGVDSLAELVEGVHEMHSGSARLACFHKKDSEEWTCFGLCSDLCVCVFWHWKDGRHEVGDLETVPTAC